MGLSPVTKSLVVQTEIVDSSEAGKDLGARIAEAFENQSPDAVILFASPVYQFEELLAALSGACRPKTLTGCSSAGEFTAGKPLQSSACAIAIQSTAMVFTAGLGENLQTDRQYSARRIVTSFHGLDSAEFEYRSALILTDALAGYTEELLEQITLLTSGKYQLFGGGAGDDARFQQTHVFFGTRAVTNAAVSLEILSHKPVGIGVSHGWRPNSAPMRVTESDGMKLISLNSISAVEVFQEHAEITGQKFDLSDPLPFFLHNILGIETGIGHKLRVPLALGADGSISCAAEVPAGSMVCIMSATSSSAAEAGAIASRAAIDRLEGNPASVALVFDCSATRLRMGKDFGLELDAVGGVLNPPRFAGCNTYGQIARVEGQFSGFHNCTAVVCAIPE